MRTPNRWRIGGGVLLVLLGLYFIGVQLFPALRIFSFDESNWLLLIVGIGVVLLVVSLLSWTPALMIPAALVSGIGALLFWQNLTGNWASWAYAWTLVPGFSGVGIFLMFLMQGSLRQALISGGIPILISITAFLIFGSLFGALGVVGQYWPLLLILLGVIILAQSVWRHA